MFKYDLMKQSIDSKYYLVFIVSSSQNLAHVHVIEVGNVAWPFLYEIFLIPFFLGTSFEPSFACYKILESNIHFLVVCHLLNLL